MTDFKVGDKVTCLTGTEAVGEIITAYIDYHKNPNLFIMWSSPTRTWYSTTPAYAKDLEHYQEPLKYSTGEEPRVGDIVYHANFKSVGEVIDVLEEGVTVDNFTIGLRDTWGLMDSVKLRKRRGD